MSLVLIEDTPPFYAVGQTGAMILSVEILPSADTSRRLEQVARLTVDEQNIPLVFTGWAENVNESGKRVTFTLQNLADKSIIENGTSFLLEFGERATGLVDFTWQTIADTQKLVETGWNVKEDTFNFSTLATDKFSYAPLENLVIYDPSKVDFDVEATEVIKDNFGNSYGTESMAVASLTLYDILEEIFVNRMGFDAYYPEIENFPVYRVDFPFSEPLMNSIKPLIGLFEGKVYERDGSVYVIDSTKVVPDGFTTPRDLSNFRCENVEIVSNISLNDIARVSYSSGSADDADFRVTRSLITTTDNGGSTLNDSLVTTVTEKVWYEYYKFSQPTVKQREEQGQEIVEIYDGLDTFTKLRSRETLTYRYDSFGRLTSTEKVSGKKVPDPANVGEFIWQEEAATEYTTAAYAQNPFNIRATYLRKFDRRESELLVRDTANPYSYNKTPGEFTQALSEAQRAANVPDDFSYSEGAKATKTFTDTYTPNRNGQVNVNRAAFDHVQGVPLYNRTDPRTGEVSLNGAFATPQQMYVLEEGRTKGTGTILDLAAGIIPSNIFIPLAQRILKKRRTLTKSLTLTRAGYDSSIRRGSIFTVSDKNNDIQGVFICEGYSVRGQARPNTWTMEIQATQISGISETERVVLDFNSGLAYPVSLYSNTSVVLPVSVECHSGYELSSETVSGLTVEGRLSGVGSYTNLETSSIDLSVYPEGSIQEFDIKLTAAVTTVPLSRIFRLLLQ